MEILEVAEEVVIPCGFSRASVEKNNLSLPICGVSLIQSSILTTSHRQLISKSSKWPKDSEVNTMMMQSWLFVRRMAKLTALSSLPLANVTSFTRVRGGLTVFCVHNLCITYIKPSGGGGAKECGVVFGAYDWIPWIFLGTIDNSRFAFFARFALSQAKQVSPLRKCPHENLYRIPYI